MSLLQCPQCRSEYTKTFRAAYEGGITNSRNVSVGVISTQGGYAQALGLTNGRSQTTVSQMCRPPAKQNALWIRLGMISIGFYGTMVALAGLTEWSNPGRNIPRIAGVAQSAMKHSANEVISNIILVLFGLALVGLAIWQFRQSGERAEKYNASEWQKKLRQWEDSIICMRCHHPFFKPGSMSARGMVSF